MGILLKSKNLLATLRAVSEYNKFKTMDNPLQINNQNTNQIKAEMAQITMPDIDEAEYFLASPYFAGFGDFESPDRFSFIDSFADLPIALKSFLSSPKTAGSIYSMAFENDLGEIEASDIASLIRDVVVGNVFVKDFPLLLASKLGIDEARASTIANKIASELFAPIIESIKMIQKQKFSDKIRMMQLESAPKIDEQTFIASQAKPLGQSRSAIPTVPQTPPVKPPVVPLPQKPVGTPPPLTQPPIRPSQGPSPVPRQGPPPGPQPLRQALPRLESSLPSISSIPKLAPRPMTPPPPSSPSLDGPPPNLPRAEGKQEDKNILDLRGK